MGMPEIIFAKKNFFQGPWDAQEYESTRSCLRHLHLTAYSGYPGFRS